MSDFLAVVAVGIGTFASRSVFILLLANRPIPPVILQSLQFVAPAVLASLVIALLIDTDGNVAIGFPEFTGLVAGATVAYKTRNHIYTLVAGMCVLWIVAAFV